MKDKPLLFFSFVLGFALVGFIDADHNQPSIFLFNGRDLSGWDTWLGKRMDNHDKALSDQPVGLNIDPRRVFTVVTHEGAQVIRISGSEWGGISTKNEYENYHLQLMFKWGDSTWGSKKGKKRDSGLLYHAVGNHGADYGFWMRSQEFQIQEGDCGDYWGVAGGMQDIRAIKKSDSEYVYNPAGQLYTFSANNKTGRHCIKFPDAEKPSGQWNTVDLYCHGDTSVHIVNGQVVMILFNSRQWDDGSAAKALTKGKIQIQSEGAEVFYKDIRLEPINTIPARLLNQ